MSELAVDGFLEHAAEIRDPVSRLLALRGLRVPKSQLLAKVKPESLEEEKVNRVATLGATLEVVIWLAWLADLDSLEEWELFCPD